MEWLTGSWSRIGETVLRTVLIFLAVMVLLRLARRRTVAQWTVTDVVTAVSIGAVGGRTSVAATTAATASATSCSSGRAA